MSPLSSLVERIVQPYSRQSQRGRMRKLLAASLLLTVSFCASPAKANSIGYELSGDVTSVDTALAIYMPGIQVGVPVHATLVYGTPDPVGPPSSGMDVSVAGYGICAAGQPLAPSPTTFYWSGSISLCAGSLAKSLLPDLLQLDAASTNPLTLPANLSFLGLDPTCSVFNGCTHTDRPGFSASINTIASIPDTGSTFLLLLIALGGVVLVKCRRGEGLI